MRETSNTFKLIDVFIEMASGKKYEKSDEYENIYKMSFETTSFLKKFISVLAANTNQDSKKIKTQLFESIRQSIKNAAIAEKQTAKQLLTGVGAQKIEAAIVLHFLTKGTFETKALEKMKIEKITEMIENLVSKNSSKVFEYIKRYFYSKGNKKSKKLKKLGVESTAQVQKESSKSKDILSEKKKALKDITDPKEQAKERLEIKRLENELASNQSSLKSSGQLNILLKKLKSLEMTESDLQDEINEIKKINFNDISTEQKIKILEAYIKYQEGVGSFTKFKEEVMK